MGLPTDITHCAAGLANKSPLTTKLWKRLYTVLSSHVSSRIHLTYNAPCLPVDPANKLCREWEKPHER
jgi:hypothetical protein